MEELIERLNNICTPVSIYGPLLYFVNNAQINIIHCNEIINLMDFFPILKHGHCQITILKTLMILYCKMNGLYDNQMINSDDLMIKAFGEVIPSHYYLDKKLMCEAVNENIISQQLNTFDVIKLSRNFRRESFATVHLTSICSLNFDTKNVEELVKDELIYEFELLKQISVIINDIPNNHLGSILKINLIEVLNIIIANKLDLLLDQLIQNKYIKLLYNILMYNDEQIKELLLYVDPRDYNNEAYNLALEINNGSELIKQNIIERNLYEKRIFNDNINSIIGRESVLPDNLLLHLKSLI
jgi:hypothetical protein